MSIQEKEKIKELNRKIKDLESVITQKDELLGDYQSIEKIADDKIKGLNTIHAEKVRSLMNSIQLLKKENASLSKQQKEHKRSELIQQLTKDISDQDLIIEVLRKMVDDPKKADAAIMAELTKGPPRIRVQTREELKMEIKELKAKLLKFEKKKPDGQENVDDSLNKSEKQLNKEVRAAMTEKAGANENKLQVNSEFILKINDLNNEIEDLKLVVAGKEAEIDKYKELISKKNREINELNQAKTDLKFVLAKNDELKEELEAVRQKLNLDVYNNYEQQIKIEEMEIIAKTHKNIQSKNNEVAKLEFDNMQIKLEDMVKTNKNLLADNRRLQDDNTTLRKQNEEIRDKNSKLHAGHTSEMEKMQAKLKEKENQLKILSEDIKNFQSKLDKMTTDNKNKDLRINSLESRIQQLEKENSLVLDSARKSLDQSQVADEIEKMGEMNYSLIELRDNLESELNVLRLENIRLKAKVKELTKLEIEYCDKIDLLEEENRLQAQKIIAMNLLKKIGADGISEDEVKLQIRKATEKAEAKIRALNERIKDLEERNTQLEEVKKIIDTSYKTEGSEI